jgi:plasmid stabilization system protein ParE
MRIRSVVRNLRDVPGSGPRRRDFGPNVRTIVVNPYVIFYDDLSADGNVVILRILHGHRNITEGMIKPE